MKTKHVLCLLSLTILLLMPVVMAAPEKEVSRDNEIKKKFGELFQKKIQERDPHALNLLKNTDRDGNLDLNMDDCERVVKKWTSEIDIYVENSDKGSFLPKLSGNIDKEISLSTKNRAKLIFVKAIVNGHKGNFVLDTGASHSVVSTDFAKEKGMLQIVGEATIVGNMEGKEFKQTHIDTLKIGEAVYEDFDMTIMPLDHLEKTIGKKIAGIIGGNILKLRPFTLNYTEGTFALGLPENLEKMKEVAVKIKGNTPFVKMHIEDKKIKFLLDSGASKSFLTKNLYKGKVIQEKADVVTDINKRNYSRKVDDYASPSKITLDGLVVEDLLFKLRPKKNGVNLIGIDFFKKYVTAFDYSNKKMYLREISDKPTPPVKSPEHPKKQKK